MPKAKVLLVGLGPIGSLIAQLALERKKSIDVVGAVDINPKLVGKDLGEVLGNDSTTGITVNASSRNLLGEVDVILHATGSFLDEIKPAMLGFCEKGVDTISTNEELSYPWYSHAKIAAELDESAKRNGCTILGTGVNPGYVMDMLPIVLSGAATKVSGFKVLRVLDATKRRVAFQRKVGIGMNVSEFEERVQSGKFGHIGLPESIAMVASALGFNIDKIEQLITPKIADAPVKTEHFGLIPQGKVIGVIQEAVAQYSGRRVAEYHVEMYAGAQNPRDEIALKGDPNLQMVIPGGTPGDAATAALMVNSITRVMDAPPGLLTVKDLRPASSVFV